MAFCIRTAEKRLLLCAEKGVFIFYLAGAQNVRKITLKGNSFAMRARNKFMTRRVLKIVVVPRCKFLPGNYPAACTRCVDNLHK